MEDRVAFLETRLSELRDREDDTPKAPGATPAAPQPQATGNNALSDIVALISLGNPEEPAYVGSSSGMSLATILNDMVQATVWNKSLPETASPGPGPAAGDSADTATDSRNRAKRIKIDELMAQSIKEPPSDEAGTKMVRAYLVQLHPRYPLLDPQELWQLHERRLDLAASGDVSKNGRFGIFKLYLVYAIGATLVQLTDKRSGLAPEGIYMAALQHISAARESRTVENIEAMTLLVIYHLRSASSHGMWYMIGLAMRTCIDLGMHRGGNERRVPAGEVDRRRRLFWTVYSLERTIAISLGRPLSISDRQIDVPLPTLSSATLSTPPTPPTMSPVALHLFRLRRIESRIHHSIYRADKPLSSLRPKLHLLHDALTSWRASLLSSIPATSPEVHYPLLHYHRAVRLLIQPFLPLLTPSDACHGLCLRAAGDICQAHKRLHQSLDYGHSFIAVQTVFVAGMTLVYGLWRWTHEVWSAALADDVRACSLVLFVMGERAEWVRRYRDSFEVLVNAAMGKLNGDEPTLRRALPRVETPDQTGWTAAQNQPAGDGAGDAHPAGGGGIASGHGSEAWPIVMELANWIDQDGGSPVWMPDFEMLQNLAEA